MDEVISNTERIMQAQYTMAKESTMRAIRQASDEGRNFVFGAMNDFRLNGIRDTAKSFWDNFMQLLGRSKELMTELTNTAILSEHLKVIFRDEIARNNLFFILVGFSVGTAGGIMIGMWMARPHFTSPVMKAIVCFSFKDDNVLPSVIRVPSIHSSTDILVRVRAASIYRIDEQITNGYGRNLRRMIQGYNTYDHQELPLVLGRACAGVVEGVGRGSKSGLEIGDEVWLAAPWYEAGLASQLVVAPESRVARKPFIIGFEGAASLPYSGCVALTALQQAGLNEQSCIGKRILVQDGCSPVGCVLTQLVKKWGAYVTATCNVRSVPVIKALGADDVIAFNCDDNIYELEERDLLLKELSIRKTYDVIFLTTSTAYNKDFIKSFISTNGILIDAVEKPLASDEYGILMRFLCSFYVRIRKCLAATFNSPADWGGPHLCYLALDRLAGYVNEGILQTVVDQVYTPDDAEKAISHICSPKAIGGTIITFRS